MALDVRPLTATLGADVSGVDMADVDGSTLEALHRAWLDYKVLVCAIRTSPPRSTSPSDGCSATSRSTLSRCTAGLVPTTRRS